MNLYNMGFNIEVGGNLYSLQSYLQVANVKLLHVGINAEVVISALGCNIMSEYCVMYSSS